MTDNEIIKALGCCIKNKKCDNCPMYKKCEFFYDRDYVGIPDVLILSLDLINRQKAENERLKSLERNVYETVEKLKNKIESEARKEFAERLKAKEAIHFCKCGEAFVYTDLFNGEIDNLVKEMEKDNNA